jgi:hypothetical protein
MALHWRPVGPEPVGTYWRRRAGLAGALVLGAFLLTRVIGGDEPDRLAGGGTASPGPSAPTSAGSRDPSAPPSAEGSEAGTSCAPAALEIVASSDKASYPVGGRPVLELGVKNNGDAACMLDMGTAGVELVVFSGSDRIWSSGDCASGAAAKPTTVAPGGMASTRLTWAGRRSLPGCEGPKAQAEAGTYRVTGRVGEQEGKAAVFQITG